VVRERGSRLAANNANSSKQASKESSKTRTNLCLWQFQGKSVNFQNSPRELCRGLCSAAGNTLAWQA